MAFSCDCLTFYSSCARTLSWVRLLISHHWVTKVQVRPFGERRIWGRDDLIFFSNKKSFLISKSKRTSVIIRDEHYWTLLVQKPGYSGRTKSTDPSHNSHNALVKNPTMHHFVIEVCTHVHIPLTKWCIEGYMAVAFWYLCNRSTSWLLISWLPASPEHQQIRKIAGCACVGNAGNVFPATATCVTARASRTCRDACRDR